MGNVLSYALHVVIARIIPLCIAVVPTHYALLWLSHPPLAYFIVWVLAIFLCLSTTLSRQENDPTMFKITLGTDNAWIDPVCTLLQRFFLCHSRTIGSFGAGNRIIP